MEPHGENGRPRVPNINSTFLSPEIYHTITHRGGVKHRVLGRGSPVLPCSVRRRRISIYAASCFRWKQTTSTTKALTQQRRVNKSSSAPPSQCLLSTTVLSRDSCRWKRFLAYLELRVQAGHQAAHDILQASLRVQLRQHRGQETFP